MEKSRTKNAIRNIKSGLVVQLVNKIMAFIVRTIFIKMLNSEYLGVNGLFTNVLNILSFAELGIGTAIIFNMYKPVAESDKEKIKSLMALYKKAYNIIGIVVFLLGLCVIPFMDYIVKDIPRIQENIIFIYLLFLFNTASSYFFTYKKSIISAHQQENIINNIDSIFYIVKSIIEILFLVLTKNFIVYLLIQILGTLIENIVLAIKANKLYPYLKEKNIKKLDKNESKGIFENVKSLFVYKIGSVILNSTDNILISALVNVSTVGYCSNYVLIINSVKSVITTALNGITASVGNLNAVGEKEQKENIFYQLTFINYWIYSMLAIGFMVLLNPFVKIWLGNEYILPISVSIALAVSFFIEGLRTPSYVYRTTLGLFQKAKATPYIAAIINIILSIILCKSWGVTGIFVATSIAQLVSYAWIDPYLIHKYEFKTPLKKFLKRYIIYTIVFTLNILVCFGIINLVNISGISGLIFNFIIVLIIPNIINLSCFFRCKEYKELYSKIVLPIIKKVHIF